MPKNRCGHVDMLYENNILRPPRKQPLNIVLHLIAGYFAQEREQWNKPRSCLPQKRYCLNPVPHLWPGYIIVIT